MTSSLEERQHHATHPQGEQDRAKQAAYPLSGEAGLDEETLESQRAHHQRDTGLPPLFLEEGGEVSNLTVWSVVAATAGLHMLAISAVFMIAGMSGVRPGVTLGMVASMGGLSLLFTGLIGIAAGALLGWTRQDVGW